MGLTYILLRNPVALPAIFLSLCFAFFFSYGQKDYFQQEVNYKIRVSLNDTLHELEGWIEIDYKNNSPETLSELIFHLWPNAYRDHKTAYARQQERLKNPSFLRAKPQDRGFIDKLNFTSGPRKLEWHLWENDPDIATVKLSESLAPGQSIKVETPFRVKIPKTFSRLGHDGQQYQITQWYPKPAVYDRDGWHPMPYLDQGEFFSEFGIFDVSITVPENYVVAASGELKTESEIEWLAAKARATDTLAAFPKENPFPPSSEKTKTLRYLLHNAHDFAWFADKRYHVLNGSVTLPNSGKIVATWVFFNNENAKYWKKAIAYVNDGVARYSGWIGDYPWTQCTAVEGALGAGGGMEYPTVTVIGDAGSDFSLETVIVHEIGHNWFYGIFGFNERKHPWMDEGLNSYYESRYLLEKYPQIGILGREGLKPVEKILGIDRYKLGDRNRLTYELVALNHLDQPMTLHSDSFLAVNYGAVVYAKSSVVLQHLAAFLGQERFDALMQSFFEEWKFKHPSPQDFKNHFKAEADLDTDWFFMDMLPTNRKQDYTIKSVRPRDGNKENGWSVTIKDRTGLAAPFPLAAMVGDTVVSSIWVSGIAKEQTIFFPPGYFTRLKIDPQMVTNEWNRRNDVYKLKGPCSKCRPFRLQFLGKYDNPYQHQLFWSPVVAWNNYDKTMLGLVFYNRIIERTGLGFDLAPLYAFGSKTITGTGNIRYRHFFRTSRLSSINVGINGRRFHHNLFPEPIAYYKISPYMDFYFRKRNLLNHRQTSLHLRNIRIGQELKTYSGQPGAIEENISTENYCVNELIVRHSNKPLRFPYELNFKIDQARTFLGLGLEGKTTLTYPNYRHGFNLRFFGAVLAEFAESKKNLLPDYRLRMANNTGFSFIQQDYKFDELLFGRAERTGFFAQQVWMRDGGFKSLTSVGTANRWMLSLNGDTKLHHRLPIKLYGGAGISKNANTKPVFLFETGIALVPFQDVFEIYFPLFTSSNINDNHEAAGRDKYYNRISFLFDLNALHPRKLGTRLLSGL